MYDVTRIRKDFPILSREVHPGVPLVYLDSGNTSQKPQRVIDAMSEHYSQHNANVARAIHTLGAEATAAYEGARGRMARFINAPSESEVIFTRNSTEAINVVARSLGDWSELALGPGDDVVVTEMEHHSNLVPWQMLCQRTGARFRWIGLTDDGRLDLDGLQGPDAIVTERTKVLAFVHQSNILGTLNPVELLVRRAREVGALTLLDASQSVPHRPVDVQQLGTDFVVSTGHKMLGPTGIGTLWGRRQLLDRMPPVLGGGSMIELAGMEGTTYLDSPARFEAGTPMIAEAVGLAAAIDYLETLGMEAVQQHEHELTTYALAALHEVPGVTIIGPDSSEDRGGTISFSMADSGGDAIHPHDVGQVLDERGVAVRVGQHCARPVCLRYGVPATTRASFAPYTSKGDIDELISGLHAVLEVFSR